MFLIEKEYSISQEDVVAILDILKGNRDRYWFLETGE
jgi:hypothetical protein